MLSEKSLAEIARERAKYPADQARSVLLAALRIAQEEHGYLSDAVMEHIAGLL
ncbi:NAD(P)H-dependent oxidoreductase subunit E, partial [Acidithiobacillus ferrooxidans]|nr:NAD(P)H-dependent oxidoreductase subunit E [Acidithiobacillus ferrooxidans]